MKLADPLNCAQNELQNGVFHKLASAPGSSVLGQFWLSTSNNIPYVFNGTAARPLDAAALTDGSVQIAALATNPLLRANHTGTQTASTISDLASTVQGYALSSFATATAPVNFGSQRVSNIAQASVASDAARWDQVQAYVAAAVQGQVAIKQAVRVYADTNITLAGTQTVDNVALAIGDRVAAGNQSPSTANGIYIVAAGSWTFAPDANVGADWAEGTEFLVSEGSIYSGAIFRQTTTGAITLGTTPLAFVQTAKINTYTGDGTTTSLTGTQFAVKYDTTLSTASGSLGVNTAVVARKYATTITGDGATSSWNVVHGLGTTDVVVQVRDSSGNLVYADSTPASASTVTISYSSPLATNATIRVMVVG